MRGKPHASLVYQPAVVFEFANDRVDAEHVAVPTIARSLARLLKTKVLEKCGADAGVEMPRILLPEQLVAKLLAVVSRCALNGIPDLLKGQQVVANVWREHGCAATVYGQHLGAVRGIATNV